MSTLDENGLTVDRFPDIVDKIESSQRANISTDFVYQDNTIIFQLNALMGSSVADNAALIEAVYSAKRLSTATGVDLDYLGALKGVPRLGDIPSSTTSQRFIGQAGTTISAGSLFANPVTNDQFTNQNTIVLSASSCLNATLRIITLLASTQYVVTINGTNYTITSDPVPTAQGISIQLRDQINADSNRTYDATVVGDDLFIETDNTDNPIEVLVTTYISVIQVETQGSLECTVPGRIVANPNTITEIVSTIPGLVSTTNPTQYSIGRLEETDDEYRIRVASGQGNPGLGTVPSIEAYLLANVPNIVDAVVIENATNSTDSEGRPAKSYEVIVTGGSVDDIAGAIWISKGAGIELVGDITQVYIDERGRPREVKFTRPTVVNMAIEIQYSLYDEEAFPGNGEQIMIDTTIEEINNLGSGVDVILGRLFGPLYSNVGSGVDNFTLRAQTISQPGDPIIPGNWSSARTAIDEDEFANITSVDIYIVQV